MRRIAAATKKTDNIAREMAEVFGRTAPVLITKAIAIASRIKRRPMPGQPPAKVEYKRRNWTHLAYTYSILNDFFME